MSLLIPFASRLFPFIREVYVLAQSIAIQVFANIIYVILKYCSDLPFFSNNCLLILIINFHILDTEGSFIVERVVDIAEAAIKHMTHIIQSSDADETGAHSVHFLSNLTVFAVNHNFVRV